MTAEKAYAVIYPINANQRKSNIRRSVNFVIVAMAVCFCINSHFLASQSLNFITMNSINSNETLNNTQTFLICGSSVWWTVFYEIYWPFIDATIYSFLPFILITTFNIFILKHIIKEKKKRSVLQHINEIDSFSLLNSRMSSLNTKIQVVFNKESTNQLELFDTKRRTAVVEYNCKNIFVYFASAARSKTKSSKVNSIGILMINVSFLFLTMPIVILQIINSAYLSDNHPSYEISREEFSRKQYFDIIKAVFELLQYMNHSINFCLYCLSGRTFRKETKIVLANFINFLRNLKNN